MQQPQGMMMQAPPNVMIPAGLPPGLAYLAGLSEVKVHQILELAEGRILLFIEGRSVMLALRTVNEINLFRGG